MSDFQKLSADYQYALLRQVVPFWLKHSQDKHWGGYFDSLTATGEVIEGDKFVTLQAQQVWAFAWLYNTFDGQPAWLNHARHGATFLSRFAQNASLTGYATLDRRGHPVAPTTDPIPDCFLAMAYAQFHRATGEDEWATRARQTLQSLLDRRDTTRAGQIKNIGDFRQLRHLGEPVALLKAVLEMQPLLDEETYKAALETVLHELLSEFLDRRSDSLREFILPEGAFVNTPEGRRLNAGLTFQAVSLLLDASIQSNNRKLATQVIAWILQLCERAWDEAAGGLNQYADLKNQPSVFPDWQQKWAWVQVEGLAALIKGYFQTRHPDCLKWFRRIHEYTFAHFPAGKHTGWHLVIDPNRQPILSARALPTTGCFSLIRCLAETAQTLAKCNLLQPIGRGSGSIKVAQQFH